MQGTILIPGAPRTVSPGEHFALVLTGGCVHGEPFALREAEGRQMAEYPGAETMVEVVNTCLAIVERWGYPGEGSTPEAWECELYSRLGNIVDGVECADYCRGYYLDWRDSAIIEEVVAA